MSRSAFGNTFNSDKIEQITEHEIGHALGLGHAHFNRDLMSTIINDNTSDISKCDLEGVILANQWKLSEINNGNITPYIPLVQQISC